MRDIEELKRIGDKYLSKAFQDGELIIFIDENLFSSRELFFLERYFIVNGKIMFLERTQKSNI